MLNFGGDNRWKAPKFDVYFFARLESPFLPPNFQLKSAFSSTGKQAKMRSYEVMAWWNRYTPVSSNIAMENGPGLKMHFLSKMGIFHCYVSLPEGINSG